MLFREDCEQGVFKLKELIIVTAWYGYGLTPARGGPFFDEMLDIIVIYVICGRGVSMVCAGTSAIEATRGQRESDRVVALTYGETMQV